MSAWEEEAGWLLVSVSTGAEASLRVHVWRTLRKLGAVYVQQSVCLLPDRQPVAKAVARLIARVRAQGGQARSLKIRLTDLEELDALIAEQRAARDVEYAEIVARTPSFLAEIEHETARGRTTYVEVEESEADLQRFERWLASVAARDYFHASRCAAARAAVEECRQALARFEAAALAADTGTQPSAQSSGRQLRLAADNTTPE